MGRRYGGAPKAVVAADDVSTDVLTEVSTNVSTDGKGSSSTAPLGRADFQNDGHLGDGGGSAGAGTSDTPGAEDAGQAGEDDSEVAWAVQQAQAQYWAEFRLVLIL